MDMEPLEGSSTSQLSGGNSELPVVQLNIKTLDSRIHSFCVDKNIAVSAFKEIVATQIGVPVGQQRLIFRGKALKDDEPLSEYNVENGDTLHLVERQLQPSPSEEAVSNGVTDGGQDSSAGQSRNLIGHISHNLVLGAINVGDPGEVVVPDVSQVIGAVLNSIGIGNLAGGMHLGFQNPQGDETEGSQVNIGSRIHGGNHIAPWPALPGQPISPAMQIPLGPAIAVPTLNIPIPDSLNTLTEFMNQMERVILQNGDISNQSASTGQDQSNTELPMNSRGVPTVGALTAVLQHAQRLLTDHAAQALSRTASRLDQDGSFNDPTVREQTQTESVQLGVAMQYLGSLLLELGRTILTLRIGQARDESFVPAGPAVYISSSGPNPLMVQPFPLQTSSLFRNSSGITTSPMAIGPVGLGRIPSNVNIHIHAGASVAPPNPAAGSGAQQQVRTHGESINRTESVDSAQARGSSGMNIATTAVPPQQPTLVPTAHGIGSSYQKEPDNVREMGIVTNSNNRTSTSSEGPHNLNLPSRSNQENIFDTSSGIPLGLGTGALRSKSRGRRARSQSMSNDGASASSQSQEFSEVRERELRSLSSLKKRSANQLPSGQTPNITRGAGRNSPIAHTENQTDVSDAISHLLQSPALDGLLAGASQQTGAGPPDMFRSMLQQFTHDPSMRNTVNQIAQQIDHHDLGSMFSNMEGGRGGQVDLSRMMQQMMPIVSQALGNNSSAPQSTSPMELVLAQSRSRRDMARNDSDLRQVVRRIENHGSSEEIFRGLATRAMNFSSNSSARESLLNELCGSGGLAQEFMEMLRRDLSRRLEDEMELS